MSARLLVFLVTFVFMLPLAGAKSSGEVCHEEPGSTCCNTWWWDNWIDYVLHCHVGPLNSDIQCFLSPTDPVGCGG